MTYKNINWDATAFFASLIETNKFAKAHDFVFAQSLFFVQISAIVKKFNKFQRGSVTKSVTKFVSLCIFGIVDYPLPQISHLV